ncbi:hypothetical protein AB0J20_16250 [Micromonospora costi]|uniref:hypothetical protein n=1 Tax=Micromonospora costi TaxID=1530042 RepID=UPI0033C9DFA4
MKRATIFQAAVGLIMFGLFLLLAGSAPRPAPPTPTQSWRPATDAEQRERDRQLLDEEMDRLWEQRHR